MHAKCPDPHRARFGDSDFEGLMNFDEWEPDEVPAFCLWKAPRAQAEQFQEAFKARM